MPTGRDTPPNTATDAPALGVTETAFARRKQGSVEILCEEIGFAFTPGMANPRLLVAFVRSLVLEIAEMRWQREIIHEKVGTAAPSKGSGELLDKVLDMLNCGGIPAMVERCAGLHALADELNPEDAYPTDHLIDMLASCVSAIWFGCDPERWGISSRHAAEAAQHVWQHRYGVSLFDDFTARWEAEWARHKLAQALVSLAFPATEGANECSEAKASGEPA